jgi:two-component system, LuxR family, sensor histidine kinase DctS
MMEAERAPALIPQQPRAGSLRRERLARALLAAVPLVAIALLALLIFGILWYVEREEQERSRVTLLNDALWVEQSLRQQLSVQEDIVARLALDSGRWAANDERLMASARQIIGANPEIASILWLLDNAGIHRAIPSVGDRPSLDARGELIRRSLEATIRPTYGDPRVLPGGSTVIDMAAPVADGFGPTVVVMVTISIDAMLERHVPWWIAEKYDVRLVDGAGQLLASKSRNRIKERRIGQAISFNPPVPGAVLHIAPHAEPSANTNMVLISAIVAVTLLAMVSLVLAHRHVRKRLDAETALRAESAFRRAMEDSLTVGMRARDLGGRIIYVNSAFCRMLGVEAGALVGQSPPMPYWDPNDLERTRAMHDRVLAGQAPAEGFELKFRRADGTLFDVLIYEAPLIDAAGQHAGWMASVLDITDRKRAEEMAKAQQDSLQRTARLVTMGEMASTLAHELNQPLAAIASYGAGCLNLVRAQKPDPARLTEALEKLGGQAQRAGQIIRRVHDFVRKSEPKIAPNPVDAMLRECIAFAETETRKAGVTVELDLPPDLPEVEADPILIQQVLINLMRNGAEAMMQTPRAQRRLDIRVAETEGGIAISVEDRGSGIPDHIRGRLFEPFVSSKADGMGMGLNICRTIVELHKGRLLVAPRPGGGTIFSVILPAANRLEMAS